MRSVYLKDCLSPPVFAQPVWTDGFDTFQGPSVKQCHLSRPWKNACSIAAPALWNEIPPEIQGAPTLLVFQSILKPKLFAQTFDCERIGLFKKKKMYVYCCPVLPTVSSFIAVLLYILLYIYSQPSRVLWSKVMYKLLFFPKIPFLMKILIAKLSIQSLKKDHWDFHSLEMYVCMWYICSSLGV